MRQNSLQPPRRTFLRGLAVAIGAFVMHGWTTTGGSLAADKTLRLVALGDSLTAGYGLAAADALPAQLQRALSARGHKIVIANAGVSGDTATGGLERLDWAVGDDTDGVIVALGANDALRGLDPALTRQALETIVGRLLARRIPVMLAGMLAPRNLDAAYRQAFDAIYPDLAKAHGLVLYPFLLDGVVGMPRLNLGDGIHPTAAGVALIVERMVPSVETFLERVAAMPR